LLRAVGVVCRHADDLIRRAADPHALAYRRTLLEQTP
jgi:hypothetical protein